MLEITEQIATIKSLKQTKCIDGDNGLEACIEITIALEPGELDGLGLSQAEVEAVQKLEEASNQAAEGDQETKGHTYSLRIKRAMPTLRYTLKNGRNKVSFSGDVKGKPEFRCVDGEATIYYKVQCAVPVTAMTNLSKMVGNEVLLTTLNNQLSLLESESA